MRSSTNFMHCNAKRVFFAAYHCMFISSTWEPVRFNHKSWTCPKRRLGQLHSRYHQKPLTKTLPHCTRSHFPRAYESVSSWPFRSFPGTSLCLEDPTSSSFFPLPHWQVPTPAKATLMGQVSFWVGSGVPGRCADGRELFVMRHAVRAIRHSSYM